MKFYYIVFIWSSCVLIDSLVHGLRCYKCDGDYDKNCTLHSVPEDNSVEICDPSLYPNRKPMCRISVYYEWVALGEKKITNVYRTGCIYIKGNTDDECNSRSFPTKYGSTECLCATESLCNLDMPVYSFID